MFGQHLVINLSPALLNMHSAQACSWCESDAAPCRLHPTDPAGLCVCLAAGVPLYAGDSSGPSGPPAGHLTLPVVSLSAADDQALFELNVRLQYSDDERLLLPALLELSGAVGLDLPAEALLLRPSILVSAVGVGAQCHAWPCV